MNQILETALIKKYKKHFGNDINEATIKMIITKMGEHTIMGDENGNKKMGSKIKPTIRNVHKKNNKIIFDMETSDKTNYEVNIVKISPTKYEYRDESGSIYETEDDLIVLLWSFCLEDYYAEFNNLFNNIN